MNVDADDRDFQRCRLVVCRLTVGIDLDRLVTWPSVCLSPASSHGNGLSCVPHAKTGVHSNMSDVSVQATVSFIITFRKRTSLHWRGRWTPPPARPIRDSACRLRYPRRTAVSSNEESAARYLHVFGLDQLDLLGYRPCADRFWFQSPRYLRAMALLENTQKAGRGDPGIDTAPPNRNRALKQGECRRGFKVSLAPIEHPRFGQMRVILGELRHVFLRLQRSG